MRIVFLSLSSIFFTIIKGSVMDPIVKKYQEVQEKFNLPKFDELQKTLGIEISDEKNILDQIRSETSDKIFSFSEKIIEPLIGGSDNFSCLFEQNMIGKMEMLELFDIYKKIQVLKWESNLLSIRYDERRTAEWIKKMWNLWNNDIQNKLIKICEKVSIGWNDLKIKKDETHYFI